MSLTGLGGRLFSSPRLPDEAPAREFPNVASPVLSNVPAVRAVKGADWREIWANAAELTGISAISGGFWLYQPALGLIAGGVGLIVVGLGLSRGSGG